MSDIWDYIKHFKKTDNWGDSAKVSPQLVLALDFIREQLGLPIVLHCAWDKQGHASNSWHYKGLATDFHVPGQDWRITLPQLYKAVLKLDHTFAIGVYPFWHNPGFHFDLRDTKTTFWVCSKPPMKKPDGSLQTFYKYFSTYEELAKELKLC